MGAYEVSPGSPLDEALRVLDDPRHYPPEVRSKMLARVNGIPVRSFSDKISARLASSPYVTISKTGRVALTGLEEKAVSDPHAGFRRQAIQAFVRSQTAFNGDVPDALRSFRLHDSGPVRVPSALAALIRGQKSPGHRAEAMAQQTGIRAVGLAMVEHADHSDPQGSYARADDIMQVHAVRNRLAGMSVPFADDKDNPPRTLPLYELHAEQPDAAVLRVGWQVMALSRDLLLHPVEPGSAMPARQRMLVTQSTLLAPDPELTAMLAEAEERDLKAFGADFVPLQSEVAAEFIEAAGTSLLPLASGLRAEQQWKGLRPVAA